MSAQDLTPEQLAASEKILKLLSLAGNAGTPEEAALANTRAQELLTKYNLDAATLEDPKAVRREIAKVEGGSYAFERELWRAVAELNFCVYQNQKYKTQEKVLADHYIGDTYIGRRFKHVTKRRHVLVGRTVNTRATQAMATYLRAAIERVLEAKLAETGGVRQSNWAWSFRKGCAVTIILKLKERRKEVLAEEKAEVERVMREAAAAGASTASASTALTVATFTKKEAEANQDFLVEKDPAGDAAVARRMEQAYTLWAAAHPDEARSKFRFRDEVTKTTWHYGNAASTDVVGDVDYGGFKAGQAAGKNIGLDQQAESAGSKTAGRLTHGR